MGRLRTRRRPPEVSSIAFPAHLPDVHTRPLMGVDFAVTCPLVRPGMPQIRFLYVRSRFCSTLLSDAASRRRPCALLAWIPIPLLRANKIVYHPSGFPGFSASET